MKKQETDGIMEQLMQKVEKLYILMLYMFTAIQSGNLEGWELKGHNQNGNKGKQ